MTTHRRIRPFNTRDTYPEQRLDNDLCQVVRARGTMVFVRGQVGQDLASSASVALGDPAGQTEQAMRNLEQLLAEAGAGLADICKVTVYLTDPRYREPVYRTVGRWLKGVRWALLKAPERLTALQQIKLAEVQAANRGLYRAYLLKEELRALYHLPNPALAPEHLAAWLGWASRSKLKPFVKLARTIRRYRDGILAAIRLGLSNARLEGLNSKVRLISHRSFGFHGPDPLIALIYLCAGGVVIDPPFTTNS